MTQTVTFEFSTTILEKTVKISLCGNIVRQLSSSSSLCKVYKSHSALSSNEINTIK